MLFYVIKVADTQTDTSTDNKGRLNIAARETKMLSILYCAAMDTNVECNELNLI